MPEEVDRFAARMAVTVGRRSLIMPCSVLARSPSGVDDEGLGDIPAAKVWRGARCRKVDAHKLTGQERT